MFDKIGSWNNETIDAGEGDSLELPEIADFSDEIDQLSDIADFGDEDDEFLNLSEIADLDNEIGEFPDLAEIADFGDEDEILDLPEIAELEDDDEFFDLPEVADLDDDDEEQSKNSENSESKQEDDLPADIPPNSKVTVDGKTYYTDDKGEIYRIDDKLLPNSEYDINGYHYKTDDKGRIISASGKLQRKDHEDRPQIKDSMESIGKGDQIDTDDRGHLIADRFNGGNGLENIVPMDSELNRHGDYGKLEADLAKAVENGDDVEVKVEPVYENDSNRPTEFKITVIINGEKEIYVFKNGGEF